MGNKCEKIQKSMQESCQKTCGLCHPEVPIVNPFVTIVNPFTKEKTIMVNPFKKKKTSLSKVPIVNPFVTIVNPFTKKKTIKMVKPFKKKKTSLSSEDEITMEDARRYKPPRRTNRMQRLGQRRGQVSQVNWRQLE